MLNNVGRKPHEANKTDRMMLADKIKQHLERPQRQLLPVPGTKKILHPLSKNNSLSACDSTAVTLTKLEDLRHWRGGASPEPLKIQVCRQSA